jgi:O-succinylbenzoate synthase
MDAGVVLRERRLKTRDGLFIHLQDEREGWGKFPLPGFSDETLEEAQALLAWAQAWRDGAEPPLPTLPSVAFGISCAQAELGGELPQAADYRAAPLCSGDPDELFARLAAMPGEKVAKVKVGLWEAVRDGMVVNLLLEAIPDLQLRLDANRAWTPLKRSSSPNTSIRRIASALRFLKNPAKRGRTRGPLAARRGSLSPGMKACARRISALSPSRACARW